jgi:hypothetical protein
LKLVLAHWCKELVAAKDLELTLGFGSDDTLHYHVVVGAIQIREEGGFFDGDRSGSTVF